MWTKRFLLVLTACMLTGCPGPNNTPQPPAGGVLNDTNRWTAPIPEDAVRVTPAELEELVKKGEVVIETQKDIEAREKAFEQKALANQEELKRLAEKNPAILELVNNGQPLLQKDPVVDTSVGPRTLLSKATLQASVLEAAKLQENPQNALKTYSASYELLDESSQGKMPHPTTLQGQSTEQIHNAQMQLEALLALQPTVDAIPETSNPSVQGTDVHPAALNVTPDPGNGTDGDRKCNYSTSGLMRNFHFPLKGFLSNMKNQDHRGVCWAFAAIGAVESRDMVQHGVQPGQVNLSEQYMVNRIKNNWANAEWKAEEAHWAEDAVAHFAEKNQYILPETAWTYNPSPLKPENSYVDSCVGYSGSCSETNHQSPMYCTSTHCGYQTFGNPNQQGRPSNGIFEVYYRYFFVGRFTGINPLPVEQIALHLRNGRALMLSMHLHQDFAKLTSPGFLPGVANSATQYQHAVLLVGYISAFEATRLSGVPAPSGGGYFIIKNSWGCAWGDGGYAYMSVDYLRSVTYRITGLDFNSNRSARWNEESIRVKAYQESKGSLVVNIKGLTEGADVTVTGPAGFNTPLKSGMGLAGLDSGTYTITARPAQGKTPTPAQQVVQVTDGKTTEVTVDYRSSTPVTFSVVNDTPEKGMVISNPPGIRCGGSEVQCTSTFPAGTQLTLQAVDRFGHNFQEWLDGCPDRKNPQCSLVLERDLTIGVVFNDERSFLEFVLEGLPENTPAGIVLTREDGYRKEIHGSLTTEALPEAEYTITLTDVGGLKPSVKRMMLSTRDGSIKTIHITYQQGPVVHLTLETLGGGSGTARNTEGFWLNPCFAQVSRSCVAAIPTGSTVVLEANPMDTDAGEPSVFAGWGGACTGTQITCTLVMGEDRQLTATFQKAAVP